MHDNIKKGDEGERLAADFLVKKGYVILERNYRHKRSEIDLIVRKDNWLVFVEVKLRKSTNYGYPEEFVDYHKERMILSGAVHYMYTIDWQGNVRYDVVSVIQLGHDTEVLHIEDAFY